jgi:hypothetical protein
MREQQGARLHLPGHRKKLLREGARADAVVLERTGVSLTPGGFSAHKLVLEVHFPDGSQAELQEKVNVADIGALRGAVGDVLPVRYDPDDHSAMALDVPAIQAEHDEAQRRRDQQAVTQARRAIDGKVQAPSPDSASLQSVQAQLAELTKLKRALDTGQIGPAEYQRRRRQIVPPTTRIKH